MEVGLEYSYEHLDKLEIEPLTVEDFELVEQHSSFIEEQLLNQVCVFYHRQEFVLWLSNTTVKLRAKCEGQAKCYYVGLNSELHIEAKMRAKAT